MAKGQEKEPVTVAVLARALIDDVEMIQRSGEEDVRETWPDLWSTYVMACESIGHAPRHDPDPEHSYPV